MVSRGKITEIQATIIQNPGKSIILCQSYTYTSFNILLQVWNTTAQIFPTLSEDLPAKEQVGPPVIWRH